MASRRGSGGRTWRASISPPTTSIAARYWSNLNRHCGEYSMFDLERFVADCRAAISRDKSHKAVQEVVGRAVSDPAAVLKALGEPAGSTIQKLHRSADLTI